MGPVEVLDVEVVDDGVLEVKDAAEVPDPMSDVTLDS